MAQNSEQIDLLPQATGTPIGSLNTGIKDQFQRLTDERFKLHREKLCPSTVRKIAIEMQKTLNAVCIAESINILVVFDDEVEIPAQSESTEELQFRALERSAHVFNKHRHTVLAAFDLYIRLLKTGGNFEQILESDKDIDFSMGLSQDTIVLLEAAAVRFLSQNKITFPTPITINSESGNDPVVIRQLPTVTHETGILEISGNARICLIDPIGSSIHLKPLDEKGNQSGRAFKLTFDPDPQKQFLADICFVTGQSSGCISYTALERHHPDGSVTHELTFLQQLTTNQPNCDGIDDSQLVFSLPG